MFARIIKGQWEQMMNTENKVYEFILVLKNVDENTPDLEDSLYRSGCDDALINFRNNTVYLDFDRKANSLEQAILSAIHDVERASIGAIVASVGPEDLVTESDIAKRLKMKRQTVSLWINGERRKSNPFPKPIMKLSDRSPLWKWSEITQWLYESMIIKDDLVVKNAIFLSNLNMALESRDEKLKKIQNSLLKKIGILKIYNNHHKKPPTSKNPLLKKAM